MNTASPSLADSPVIFSMPSRLTLATGAATHVGVSRFLNPQTGVLPPILPLPLSFLLKMLVLLSSSHGRPHRLPLDCRTGPMRV